MFAEGFLMACTVGGSPDDVGMMSLVVVAKPAYEYQLLTSLASSAGHSLQASQCASTHLLRACCLRTRRSGCFHPPAGAAEALLAPLLH